MGVSGESAPFVSKNLEYITIDTWKDFRRTSENADDADQAQGGVPDAVIRSNDGRLFGFVLYPIKYIKFSFFMISQQSYRHTMILSCFLMYIVLLY